MSAFSKRLAPWLGVALPIAAAAAAMALSGAVPRAWAQSQDSTATGGKGRVTLHINADSDDSDADTDRDTGVRITIDGRNRSSAADYVRFGDNVHIPADQRVAGDVVTIGGNIDVEGEVEGDCVAVGGKLRLGPGAKVGGEVVCIGGRLTLEDESRVRNDVVSVWGTLDRSPTSEVGGQITEVTGPLRLNFPKNVWGLGHGFGYGTWEFLGRVMWVVILIGIGAVVFHLFPARMENLTETVRHRGMLSFLAGLAGGILWLPVFVLLCVTLIGIPLAVFVLVPLTIFGTLAGYVASARVVGSRRGTLGPGPSVVRGLLILEGTLLLGLFLSVFGSVFEFLGFILGVIGWSVVFVAATVGWGAFLITRFRPQPQGAYERPGAPPPPYGPPPGYPMPPPGYTPPPPNYPPPGSTPPHPGTQGAGGSTPTGS